MPVVPPPPHPGEKMRPGGRGGVVPERVKGPALPAGPEPAALAIAAETLDDQIGGAAYRDRAGAVRVKECIPARARAAILCRTRAAVADRPAGRARIEVDVARHSDGSVAHGHVDRPAAAVPRIGP